MKASSDLLAEQHPSLMNEELLVKITLLAQCFSGFKKNHPTEPETHYLLLATTSLSHMDVQVAAAYDFSLLMGLRDLLLQQQNPSPSPPNE